MLRNVGTTLTSINGPVCSLVDAHPKGPFSDSAHRGLGNFAIEALLDGVDQDHIDVYAVVGQRQEHRVEVHE